jgi:anoctamin-8
MYFAWLGHYTTALSIPAIAGFFFWVSPVRRNRRAH